MQKQKVTQIYYSSIVADRIMIMVTLSNGETKSICDLAYPNFDRDLPQNIERTCEDIANELGYELDASSKTH